MIRSNTEVFLSGIWRWREKPIFWKIALDLFEGRLKKEEALKKLGAEELFPEEGDFLRCVLALLEKKREDVFETVRFVKDHDIGVEDAIADIMQGEKSCRGNN